MPRLAFETWDPCNRSQMENPTLPASCTCNRRSGAPRLARFSRDVGCHGPRRATLSVVIRSIADLPGVPGRDLQFPSTSIEPKQRPQIFRAESKRPFPLFQTPFKLPLLHFHANRSVIPRVRECAQKPRPVDIPPPRQLRGMKLKRISQDAHLIQPLPIDRQHPSNEPGISETKTHQSGQYSPSAAKPYATDRN